MRARQWFRTLRRSYYNDSQLSGRPACSIMASTEPVMPYYIALTSYISWGVLFIFGHFRDLLRQLFTRGRSHGAVPAGYAPLCKDYEDFYTRRMYLRIHDVFNRPIASAPDSWIDVCERESDPEGAAYALKATSTTRRCLNLGSYNYLGFAAADPYCTQRVRVERVVREAKSESLAQTLCPGAQPARSPVPRDGCPGRVAGAWRAPLAAARLWAPKAQGADRSRSKRVRLTRPAPPAQVLDTLGAYGASTCRRAPRCFALPTRCAATSLASPLSGRQDLGQTDVHEQLEKEVAAFVGKPAALVFGMGFATNSLTLPCLMRSKGTLVISDALNHSSIVAGVRGSAARVKVFRHNEPEHLERVLRAAIAEGQPRTHRPWNKILIVVEGIYSMEGEVCRLAEIVALKKRYKAYLYLDEAHSIGALGLGGRGVTEHLGVAVEDVDMMARAALAAHWCLRADPFARALCRWGRSQSLLAHVAATWLAARSSSSS